jgi:hypothetical protein
MRIVVAAPKPTEEGPIEEGLNPEQRRLLASRTLGLLELGFTLAQTLQLVHRADVVHDAADLLERGCPHTYVVKELT